MVLPALNLSYYLGDRESKTAMVPLKVDKASLLLNLMSRVTAESYFKLWISLNVLESNCLIPPSTHPDITKLWENNTDYTD